MALLLTKHLKKEQENGEYMNVKSQDGVGFYCDEVIVDEKLKKAYFFTALAGSNRNCRKIS